MSNIKMENYFTLKQYRGGKLIKEITFPNGVVDEGKDHMLDVSFISATTQQTWYLGLYDGTGTLADDDTMASHPGWTEFILYDEATRPAWGPDAASTQSISNSTTVDFSINASGTVKGCFVTSDNTISGTSGILWATADINPDLTVSNGDTIQLTYTVNLT